MAYGHKTVVVSIHYTDFRHRLSHPVVDNRFVDDVFVVKQ